MNNNRKKRLDDYKRAKRLINEHKNAGQNLASEKLIFEIMTHPSYAALQKKVQEWSDHHKLRHDEVAVSVHILEGIFQCTIYAPANPFIRPETFALCEHQANVSPQLFQNLLRRLSDLTPGEIETVRQLIRDKGNAD